MQLVYKRAAEALDELCGKRGSLKYIIFSKKKSGSLAFRKRVYAVAIETVKRKLPVSSLLYYHYYLVTTDDTGYPIRSGGVRHVDAINLLTVQLQVNGVFSIHFHEDCGASKKHNHY